MKIGEWRLPRILYAHFSFGFSCAHIGYRVSIYRIFRCVYSIYHLANHGSTLDFLQDHLITMTQNLNHYEKILSRSHSNYLAQISIEMTDANNQINDVLSKMTALGTVLIPMNLITGQFFSCYLFFPS